MPALVSGIQNIEKSGRLLEKENSEQAYIKGFIMPDLKDYSKRIKEKVMNGLV